MAGIFPDLFGAGAGDGLLPFGSAPLVPGVIDGNRNAILGYLAAMVLGWSRNERNDAIPAEACYLGWQESLILLAKLVEAEIPDQP